MRVRYLGAAEYARARGREAAAERLIRAHVGTNYSRARLLDLRVDVLRGDLGVVAYHSHVQLADIVVEVSGYLDAEGRPVRVHVR